MLTCCCFHRALMSWGEKTRDVFKPSGTQQPQVSAGLSVLESVLLKSGKEKRPHSSSNPLKCCFCDRSTDQFCKPRGAYPCSYAPGKSVVFEADSICVLRRQTVKHVDLSWASACSTGLEMKTFAYSELFANLSHWGTAGLTVLPHAFHTNPPS